MWKYHLVGSVVLVATFAMLLGCGKKPDDNAQQPQPNPAPNPAPVVPKPPDPPAKAPSLGPSEFKMTAEDFEKEFSADKKAAEAKYVGKVVELSGSVDYIARYGATQGQVGLRSISGGAPFCTFVIDDAKLVEKVGKGQKVRLRGRFQSDRFQKYFLPAEVVDFGTPTVVPLTAEQLVKEYSAAPDALEEKYRGKTLLVTGEVSAVTIGMPDPQFVELKGGEKPKVLCFRHPLETWEWPAHYKKGARVRFIGKLTSADEEAVRLLIDIPLTSE